MIREEEKEEDEQEERENGNDILLQKEIQSSNDHFGYALREENRILFNQCYLNVCWKENNIVMRLTLKEKITLLNLCLWS
jgi:hypothetical protein